MHYTSTDHTYVICAYQESSYLEECVRSLKKQTTPSNIIIATSTPNAHIDKIASDYKIPVICNHGEHGIAGDWNFAVSQADTPLVTIAHQDDIYGKHYTESILKTLSKCRHPLIAFTDYCELRKDGVTRSNRLLKVKRLMLSPLLIRKLWSSIWVRRRILSPILISASFENTSPNNNLSSVFSVVLLVSCFIVSFLSILSSLKYNFQFFSL